MARPLRVVSFGECMLELQGQAFGTLRQTYGGDTLNTAVYLARCGRAHGLRVDYATALGDDPLSDGLLQRWQAEGLGVGLVRRLPGRLPGLYLIEVDDRGERRFSYWRDQSAARAYFDTPHGQTPLEQQVEGIDALYLSGISLAILPPAGRVRLLAVARALAARGAMVAFDNNYRPRLWPDRATAQACFADFAAVATVALMTLDDECALWGDAGPACDSGAAVQQQQLERTLALPCPEAGGQARRAAHARSPGRPGAAAGAHRDGGGRGRHHRRRRFLRRRLSGRAAGRRHGSRGRARRQPAGGARGAARRRHHRGGAHGGSGRGLIAA